MDFFGMDVLTVVTLGLLSILLTWIVAAYLDTREEKKREVEFRKLMDRLLLRHTDSSKDDFD